MLYPTYQEDFGTSFWRGGVSRSAFQSSLEPLANMNSAKPRGGFTHESVVDFHRNIFFLPSNTCKPNRISLAWYYIYIYISALKWFQMYLSLLHHGTGLLNWGVHSLTKSGGPFWQNPSTVVSHKDIRNDVQQRRRLQTTQIWRCRYMLFKDIQRHCTIDIDSFFWHHYL